MLDAFPFLLGKAENQESELLPQEKFRWKKIRYLKNRNISSISWHKLLSWKLDGRPGSRTFSRMAYFAKLRHPGPKDFAPSNT